jgi:hypothetical protein
MSDSIALASSKLDSLQVERSTPDSIKLAGVIKERETIAELAAIFRAVHAQAIEHRVSQMKVDVAELTFISASAIRLFVDWVAWVNDSARPYKLRFVTSRFVPWQRSTFQSMASLTKDVFEIEKAD